MSRVMPSAAAETFAGVEHLCRQPGCGRWGAWGYDGGEGVIGWWCIEHRPDHDPVRPVVEQNWVSDGHEG